MKIKLEAEIDLDRSECKVKPIQDKWADFGMFLEVVGFLAAIQDKPIEEMADYARQYILKAGKDYKSHIN